MRPKSFSALVTVSLSTVRRRAEAPTPGSPVKSVQIHNEREVLTIGIPVGTQKKTGQNGVLLNL